MGVLTTGVPALDDLIDGVQVGDNLVVLGADDDLLRAVGTAFLAAVTAGPTVLVRTDAPTSAPDGVHLLPWWEAAADTDGFRAALADLDEADRSVGRGASFLVDSLTGVQDRWGTELALETFLSTCPRLYRRDSVAMWLLRRDAHDRAFLDRLAEITQVVIDVRATDTGYEAEVLVAAGRPDPTVGRRVELTTDDTGVVAAGEVTSGRRRLGALVRTQRTERGLTQAELARRIGVTPSALSQVERGVRGLSAESLIRIWEVLGVPFGPDDRASRGYRIARRGSHREQQLTSGVRGTKRLDEPDVAEVWELTVDAGASGRQPLFPGKTTEVVLVRRGALDVEVGGHHETLHDGDALVATDAVIGAWANPTPHTVELVWSLVR